MDNRNEIEFDLMQLVRFLLKRIWIVVIIAAICAGSGYFISKSTTVPKYTSHCRIYVYQKVIDSTSLPEGSSVVDYDGLVLATQLAKDCQVLITGLNVSQCVVEELGLDMSPSRISDSLLVSYETSNRILQIEYTDTDPERAVLILDKVCEVASRQIYDIMKVDVVSTVYSAQMPKGPNASTVERDAILAGAVGLLLSIGVLVVLFLMDDTVRNEDDVERYLGLSTLAAVPISPELTPAVKASELSKGKKIARFIKK